MLRRRQPAAVVTGELKNQVDRIWDAFWSGIGRARAAVGRPAVVAVLELRVCRDARDRRQPGLPSPPHARRRRLDVLPPHVRRSLHSPDPSAARSRRRHDRRRPMGSRDTNGDAYECMLGQISAAGTNGQFQDAATRHPADRRDGGAGPRRHDLRPGLRDVGLLVAAGSACVASTRSASLRPGLRSSRSLSDRGQTRCRRAPQAVGLSGAAFVGRIPRP